MFLPYNVDVPMQRWPIANWLLITATVIISLNLLLVSIAELPTNGDSVHGRDELAPSVLALGLQRGKQFSFWQLITHVFVHAGVVHLAGNMIFLFCFGNAVNAKIGHLRYLLVYVMMGIGAGLIWLALGHGKAAVGASGAIMGITGVYFVLYPRNNVRVFRGLGYLGWASGTTEIAGFWVISCEILFDLCGWLLSAHSGVAYVSHLGGMLIGIVTAIVLLKMGLVRSAFYEENLLQVLGLQPQTERRYHRHRKQHSPADR